MLGDVHLREVIDLHTQVLDLQASVEFRPSVDTGAMSSIQDVGNSQPLQPPLVHSHAPVGKEAGAFFARVRTRKVPYHWDWEPASAGWGGPQLAEYLLLCSPMCPGLTGNIVIKRDRWLSSGEREKGRGAGQGRAGERREQDWCVRKALIGPETSRLKFYAFGMHSYQDTEVAGKNNNKMCASHWYGMLYFSKCFRMH